MLTEKTLPLLQRALADAGVDGWLLYDFHGVNPVAAGMLRLEGMLTRRIFALIPAVGLPVAITHDIEQGPWIHWPRAWRRERYSTWRALEGLLRAHVSGKRVAMEYVPGDASPYVDRVPAGVLEMVRSAGASVVSSADLVSRFYATWSPDEVVAHSRAAEIIAGLGREAITRAGHAARGGHPVTEHALQQHLLDGFARAGLETDHPPIVAAGPNAANPHYMPSASSPVVISPGDILLVDLWARFPGSPYADQTWMGSLGEPAARAASVWGAVRDARDAAIALLRARASAGTPTRGAEVDDAARGLIVERGFGEFFTHRTGHSIDPRELHGSGPNIDNFETREERLLIPGIGFSIEPGIYIAGEIGVRSEVNAFMGGTGGVTITPTEYQKDLLVV